MYLRGPCESHLSMGALLNVIRETEKTAQKLGTRLHRGKLAKQNLRNNKKKGVRESEYNL